MSRQFTPQFADPKGILLKDLAGNGILAVGTTVPASKSGYAKGCIFMDQDAAGGLQLWVNEGTVTSCTFVAIASASSGTFATLVATAATLTAATITTATIPTAIVTALSIVNETDAPGASTAALGTTTTDAAVLPAATAKVYPTTAADDTVGVRIHANDKVTGRMLFIGNGVSNKILKVYAPSGGTINGAAGDAAFSSASGKGVIIYCLSGAGNTWLAW